jgi:hypothetical protein
MRFFASDYVLSLSHLILLSHETAKIRTTLVSVCGTAPHLSWSYQLGLSNTVRAAILLGRMLSDLGLSRLVDLLDRSRPRGH